MLPSFCERFVCRNRRQHHDGDSIRDNSRKRDQVLDTKLRDDLIHRCLMHFSCTVSKDLLVSKAGAAGDESEFLPHSRSQVNEAIDKAESSADDESITEKDPDNRNDGTEKQLQGNEFEIKIAKNEESRSSSLVSIPLGDSVDDQTTHIRVPLPGYDIDGVQADFVHEETEPEETEEARRRNMSMTRFFQSVKIGTEEDAWNYAAERCRNVPDKYHNPDRRDVPRFCAICLSGLSIGETVTWSSNSECTHMFHSECIHLWLSALGKKNAKSFLGPPTKKQLLDGLDCPCCRQPFVSSSINISDRPFVTSSNISDIEKNEEESIIVGDENC